MYSLEGRYQSLGIKIRLTDTTLDMRPEIATKTDTPSAIMVTMVDKPVELKLTSGGKVKSTAHLDKLIDEAFTNFPTIDPLKKKKIADQFMQAFGEAAIKGVLETGSPFSCQTGRKK